MIWWLFVPVMVLATMLVGIVATLAARVHPIIRFAATVSALSAVAMPVAIVLHNITSAWIGADDAVTFIVALLVAPAAFALGTFVLARDLEKDERRSAMARGFTIAASGVSLMVAYVVFDLVIAMFGDVPEYVAVVEAIVLPVAALVTAVGAAMSAIALARENTLFPDAR
ncbi:MAG TPA: hypothetical protein VI814_01795 [Candidatus Limnocylindria bacterium]